MVDRLIERYSPFVDLVVIVASPSAEPEFRRHITAATVVVQEEPTRMLPPVLCARPLVLEHQPHQVWVTWCDQVGISHDT